MDKIIYTCNAQHIPYVFPKRKWWNFSKKTRELRLEIRDTLAGEELVILTRVLEEYPQDFKVSLQESDREEIWNKFAKQTLQKRRFEILFVIDPTGDEFADVAANFAEDINYFAVYTEKPENYERLLRQLEREFGLIGMVFETYRDFKRYQKMVCEGKRILIFTGNGLHRMENGANTCYFHFPPNSLVIDFGEEEVEKRMFRGKRIGTDYVSLPIFLDNIVKNRYNSVVNEGLQKGALKISPMQPIVYRAEDENKLGEKRKGIRKWKKRRIS